MKIYNYITNLQEISGVQKVMQTIHSALKEDFDIKYASTIDFCFINKDLNIIKNDYIKVSNFKDLRNSIVILHERRIVLELGILNRLFNLNITIIYIHHNEMHTFAFIPMLADKVVAISDKGIKNLKQDLHVKSEKIVKIYNCCEDRKSLSRNRTYDPDNVRILHVGKIFGTKQQIELVKHLYNSLSFNIQIHFAGTGPDELELKTLIESHAKNFKYLGYQSDIPKLMLDYDYILLYSLHEGLPISLIEGLMTSTPLITNNVGGCGELVDVNKNGYIATNWKKLSDVINNLSNITEAKWKEMSIQSRNKYIQNFTFEIFKENYKNLIYQLIDQKQNTTR